MAMRLTPFRGGDAWYGRSLMIENVLTPYCREVRIARLARISLSAGIGCRPLLNSPPRVSGGRIRRSLALDLVVAGELVVVDAAAFQGIGMDQRRREPRDLVQQPMLGLLSHVVALLHRP